jgi:phage terminase large subunit
MSLIQLPHGFNSRHYQKDALKAFFIDECDRLILVWPRRHGKGKTVLNILVAAALRRVGVYFYIFPTLQNARDAVWDNIDGDGNPYLSHIPEDIIVKKDNQQMKIWLINGSIIQLQGIDKARFDKLRSTNPVGIVFDEYAEQNEMGWMTLYPVLAENKGWAIFVFTPRGKNHAHKLYVKALEEVKLAEKEGRKSRWHVSYLTQGALKNDGTPVVNEAEIDEMRRLGFSEDFIAQEMFCSWDAALVGAYYANQIRQVHEEGRLKTFDILPNFPVYTAWDIGHADATAIWWIQPVEKELRMIKYYEASHESPREHALLLKSVAKEFGFRYAKHFFPHDAFNKIYGLSGRATVDVMKAEGVQATRAPEVSILEGINSVRYLFPRLVFHEKYAEEGFECLKAYKSEFVQKDGVLRKQPKHNWASHGADAMRMFGVSWKDRYTQDKMEVVRKYKKYEYRFAA